MDEVVVICAGSVTLWLLLLGFIALMRWMAYRETLALADRGLVRGDRLRGGDGKDTLRWGIMLTAVGLALCVGLYPIGLLGGTRWFLGLGPWMLAGLLPTFFGVGLIVIYVLTREEPAKNGNGHLSVTPPPAAAPSAAPAPEKE